MSFVQGRGRYARTTYPKSPGAGGGASNAPLSRQRFIDGGTLAAGPGAASAPFKTIADFIASRGDASAQDAIANYVGWLMPSLNGYMENVSFPPYVSTELRADSFSPAIGTAGGTCITGDLRWDNIGPATAGAAAFLTLHNIPVTGDLTVTDDRSAPQSGVIISGDEQPESSTSIGSLISSTTTNLESIFFFNSVVRNGIDAGATTDRATVSAVSSLIGSGEGNITAKAFGAIDCSVSCSSIDVFALAQFEGCQFAAGTTPQLTAPLAIFDGSSWISFLESRGTRAVGTVVITEGGSSGALVEGAALPATGAVNISIDGTNADAGYTEENCGNHYSTPSPITGDVTATLKLGGALKVGDTMLLTKSDLSAFSLIVHNNAGVQIATVPSLSRGFVLVRYNGTDWIFVSGGALAA
jgi:hypothetical protein